MSPADPRTGAEESAPVQSVTALSRELAWRWGQLGRRERARLSRDPALRTLAPALHAIAREAAADPPCEDSACSALPPGAVELLAVLERPEGVATIPVKARAALFLFGQALADGVGLPLDELCRRAAAATRGRA